MTRVPTYSTYMNMLNQTIRNKDKFELYNYQTITGLKAPNYSGYGMSSYSIVSMESSLTVTENFIEKNKILTTEIKTINTSLDAIDKSLSDLKSALVSFSGMDLEKITPDYTGGEITFTGKTAASYVGKTLTVNDKTYTFVDNGDTTGNNIDLSGLTEGTDDYPAQVMNRLKEKLEVSDAEDFVDFTFENAKFTFPLYTIDGESSVLSGGGVKTGDYVANNEHYREMQELQSMAFAAMKSLVDSLNVFANGKYLFGGGVSEQPPVNFPFDTLEEFQSYYDGINITYPSSAAADLSGYAVNGEKTGGIELINNGGNKGTIKATNVGAFLKKNITANDKTTGDLSFNSDKNTITATQYGAFNTLKAGDTLVIQDAGDTHNGSYVIKEVSADGKTITFDRDTPIRADDTIANGGGATFSTSFPIGSVINMEGFGNNISPQVQVTGISADGTELYVTVDPSRWPATSQDIAASSQWNLENNSYYQGGNLVSQKIITENQSITLDATAADPAFEKMFRALGLIAQGNLVDTRNPTTSGADVDPMTTLNRVDEALKLIDEAFFSGGKADSAQNPDLYTVQAKMNSNIVVLNNVSETQTLVKNNLENNIHSLKNVDQTEAATKALLAYNNLEASYAVMQNAMSLSLLNYLK